jgi:hypothetical protein
MTLKAGEFIVEIFFPISLTMPTEAQVEAAVLAGLAAAGLPAPVKIHVG